MKIQFKDRNTELTPVLRAHVERRLALVLARFEDRIDRVNVSFSDTDGRRGAVARQCRIDVAFVARVVNVEDTDVDLFVAVDRATERLSRSVARALEDWDAI